jgi:hypothetical protein
VIPSASVSSAPSALSIRVGGQPLLDQPTGQTDDGAEFAMGADEIGQAFVVERTLQSSHLRVNAFFATSTTASTPEQVAQSPLGKTPLEVSARPLFQPILAIRLLFGVHHQDT